METDEIKDCFRIIENPIYQINDSYKLAFLTFSQYEILGKALSTLRRLKQIDGDFYHSANSLFRHFYKNSIKIKELDSLQPRYIAQKFIGKKKIRSFIFNRDNNKCLSCGVDSKLTLDHIMPISQGGQNEISNLQTLCKSCNSRKRDTFKDYRNGAR